MKCLAVLVNYHCVDLILAAVASIADDPECDRIHVVDNSENPDEARLLRAALPEKALLLVNDHNTGFAAACNRAVQDTPHDCVLLLNPDAVLQPGALGWLKNTLRNHPGAGAVGPRVFWDEAQTFFLPPSTYPSPADYVAEVLGRRWAWVRHRRQHGFRQFSLRYWAAANAMEVPALSGGHVLLRSAALKSVNGLFDTRYFMYWEDTDLMRRLHNHGWKCLLEPRAVALHAYEHSERKDALIVAGWPPFRDRYFSGGFWKWLTRYSQSAPAAAALAAERLTANPQGDLVMDLPEELQASWLLEISPSPEFIPSIGHFGRGPQAVIPGRLAARFTGRDYYARVGLPEPSSPTLLKLFRHDH